MYNSQYYSCEQIDQRLLQGYLDDYNNQNNTSLTKAQFHGFLKNLFDNFGNLQVDNEPTPGSNNLVKSGGVVGQLQLQEQLRTVMGSDFEEGFLYIHGEVAARDKDKFCHCTTYIPVRYGNTIYWKYSSAGTVDTGACAVIYDENKNVINYRSANVVNERTFTLNLAADQGAAYMRFSFHNDDLENIVVTINGITALKYEAATTPVSLESIIGVSLIATTNNIPNIDTVNKTIDFNLDPVFIVGNKSYALGSLQSDRSKFRNVLIYEDGNATGATVLCLNIKTYEIYAKGWTTSRLREEVVIGAFRLTSSTHNFISANFPFDYSIDGVIVKSEITSVNNKIDGISEIVEINPLSFIGKGANFSYSTTVLNLSPGKRYIIKTPMTWDWSGYTHTVSQFQLTVESYNSNDVKTIIVGVPWEDGLVLDPTYSFVVPEDSAYIKMGGRAALNVEVPFTIYKDDGGAETFINSNLCQVNLKSSVEVIAHRGYHQNNVPENSIDAYRFAGYMGFDKAETDFCPTSDGELVLMHDASINRTMRNASDYSSISQTVNVNEKTLAELRNNYVLASDDVRYRRPIPTLEEYFKVCKDSGVFPLPEIKTTGVSQQNIRDAFDLGCEILGEGNFGFCSFSSSFLDYARTLSSKTLLYYINESGIANTVSTITGESRNTPYNVWYPNSTYANANIIKSHHAVGIKVAMWTIIPGNYARLVNMGCDEVATDLIAPNIANLATIGITSTKSFSAFDTDGTVNNNILTLDTGESLSYKADHSVFNGMYYISVICKGSFTITGNHLIDTIDSQNTDRYIYKSLLFANETPSIKIQSNSDGSTIEFVELYISNFNT